MSSPGVGRPRLHERKRRGETARDEVLDAAAELFTTRGYAATSTRRVADAVGIRQASLYHHFATKDDMLAALLSGTVTPALAVLHTLEHVRSTPEVRLHALVLADARQLWTSPWNLGILYLLPEVRAEPFTRFHHQRDDLRAGYRRLSHAVIDALGASDRPGADHLRPDADEELAFRLVESLPNLRADGVRRPDQPERTADLALHVLGRRGDRDALRAASADLLAAVAPQPPTLEG